MVHGHSSLIFGNVTRLPSRVVEESHLGVPKSIANQVRPFASSIGGLDPIALFAVLIDSLPKEIGL